MLPDYWSQAGEVLAATDPVMDQLVSRFRGQGITSRGDPFQTLARAIVGQQISVKAADAVWGRFAGLMEAVTPGQVLALGAEGLLESGLSRRKQEYVLDLATHFENGSLNPATWEEMEDKAIMAQLTQVRGIGPWTAEMFLIFNLMRPDVFPLDDLGLQKAITLHYFSGEMPGRKTLEEFGQRWQPWRTVATWYLWRSLDPVPVEY